MKKLLIVTCFLFCVSCEKFLDAPQPTDGFNLQVVFSGSNTIRAYFNGIYSTLRSFNGGGLGLLINTRNVLGKDLIGVLSFRSIYEYRASSLLDASASTFAWSGFYSLIDQTNVIIHNLPNANISDEDKASFDAEAKALRAYCYFELLLHYAPAYAIDPNNAAIPLYTTPSTLTTEGKPRSTVQEVYDLILQDLQSAVTPNTFTYERSNKGQFSLEVIQGVLARVYLHMGEWENAKDMAVQAANIQISGTSVVSDPALDAGNYTLGFRTSSAREWMWSNISNLNENNGSGSFSAAWGEDAGFPMLISKELLDLLQEYRDTDGNNLDIRAATAFIWIDEIDDEPVRLGPQDESFISSKFGFSLTFDIDFPLMRVPEMYLIAAEGFARTGDMNQANLLLKALQANRAPQAVLKDKITQQGLIDTILIERRKELYGEGLADWLDNKRLNLSFTRDNTHLFGSQNGSLDFQYTIPVNSPCYYFPIPSNEILYNNNINDQLPQCDRSTIQ